MVNQSVTETKDEPEYSLSAVHRIAGFQQVVYVSRRVQKHVNDLGYQLDDVCALLCSLDEDDFRKSERYVDDQRWHDVYLLRHPTLNAPRERLYIKFRLSRDFVLIDICSFNPDGWQIGRASCRERVCQSV